MMRRNDRGGAHTGRGGAAKAKGTQERYYDYYYGGLDPLTFACCVDGMAQVCNDRAAL